MRRKRKGTHAQTRKTILGLGAVVGVVILAIVAVNIYTFEGPPLMDPEDPAIIAKRAGADNRFNAIVDIAERFSDDPPPRQSRDEEKFGFRGEYEAPCGSIAHIMGLQLFDDDPALRQYIQTIDTFVPEIEDALSDGYVMTPPIEQFADVVVNDEGYFETSRVAQRIAASGHVAGITNGDWQRAHDQALLAMRLTNALGIDGRTIDYAHAARAQTFILRYYYQSVIAQAPADQVEDLINAIEAESLSTHDLTPNLEFDWRCFDSPQVIALLWGQDIEDIRERGFDSRIYVMQFMSRAKRDIRNHQEDMLRVAKGYSAAYREWLQSTDEDLDRFGYSINSLTQSMEAKDNLRATIQGLRAAHAIHQHYTEQGAWPESLEGLGDVAIDPCHPKEGTFRYRVVGDDFTLWSVGADGHNHKAYTGGRIPRDVIIHKAADECAAEHQEFLDKF